MEVRIMKRLYTTLAPVFLLLIAFSLIDAGISTHNAEARSKFGGRSFKMNRSYKKTTPKTNQSAASQKKSGSGMNRGFMGGLLVVLLAGGEDFISVLFKLNLLDYTVDKKINKLIDSSMTNPVKFEEEWTWIRPTGSQDWELEGIKEV